MKYIEKLPPIIRIFLDEDIEVLRNPSSIKSYLRRLRPELKRQAKWTMEKLPYMDREALMPVHSDFTIAAAGPLNPLSHRGICGATECRIKMAYHFARTLGLYADVITIPDTLTYRFTRSERLTDSELFQIANDILVLKVLHPLIKAGILRFRSGFAAYCDQHYREFIKQVDKAASTLMPMISSELSFAQHNDFIEMRTG